jgi:hypothetical protein
VDLLKLELKELADLEIDFDLSITGFSTGEIDVLLSSKVRFGDDDAGFTGGHLLRICATL